MASPGNRTGAVLVPSGLDLISYPCIRSLNERGVRTVLLSEYDSLSQAKSRFCDEFVSISAEPEQICEYKDALLETVKREEITTVLPTREHDIYVLSHFKDEFEEYTSLAVPAIDTLTTVHDRMQLAAAAEAADVPVPETRRLSDVPATVSNSIVKSRYNLLTGRYLDSYPDDRAEEVSDVFHIDEGDEIDTDAVRDSMKHDPIVQEFVPNGGKYMFAALYEHGEPVATFQHEQIRGDSYIGGGGVYRRSMYDPALERVGRRLLSHLDWHRVACIEYIRDDETGEYKLLEVNPRFWQSLPSTVHSNADFPYYYWLQVNGRSDEVDPTYEVGTGTHFLYGEVRYLASLFTDSSPHVSRPAVSETLLDVLRTCYREPKFDYLRLDDPRPFLHGFISVLRSK